MTCAVAIFGAIPATPARAGDISRPIVDQAPAPQTLDHGRPSGKLAPPVGYPQLSLLEAFPITGGALIQETFQSPPAVKGAALGEWILVTPAVGSPYRLVRSPDGSGHIAESTNGGATWKNTGPAEVKVDGDNVIFTALVSEGADENAVVEGGWTATKPDGTGATAATNPVTLGALEGTGPFATPRTGTFSPNNATPPAGTPKTGSPCTLSNGAHVAALGVDLTGVWVTFTEQPTAGTFISLASAPDLAHAFAPARLAGDPTTGTFSVFPFGLGVGAARTVRVHAIVNGVEHISPEIMLAGPLSLNAGGALQVTVSVKRKAGECASSTPLVPVSELMPGAAKAPPPTPATPPTHCNRKFLEGLVAAYKQRIADEKEELKALEYRVTALANAYVSAKKGGEVSLRASLEGAGFLSTADEFQAEFLKVTNNEHELEADIRYDTSELYKWQAELNGCK